tara:strand:- start:726 stop:1046 length:321 start_codon:yes stop_codon:yes gene_type:complete
MANYTGQDWEPVVFHKKTNNNEIKKEVKKYEEDFIEKKAVISVNNSKLIQQARMNKKMTQQQLAQKINKDQKTIQLYESGKTVPDYGVMCKIEKVLGIKLNKKKSQ